MIPLLTTPTTVRYSRMCSKPTDGFGSTIRTMFGSRSPEKYNYAVYKLRKSTDRPAWQFLKSPADRQIVVLSDLASASFVLALVSSTVLVYCDALGGREEVELYVRTEAIVVALIGAALRTVQLGLALDQEIERYSDYRGRTFHLRDRFNHSAQGTPPPGGRAGTCCRGRLTAFLRTHHKARFVFQ